jgi:hypothetical protein
LGGGALRRTLVSINAVSAYMAPKINATTTVLISTMTTTGRAGRSRVS